MDPFKLTSPEPAAATLRSAAVGGNTDVLDWLAPLRRDVARHLVVAAAAVVLAAAGAAAAAGLSGWLAGQALVLFMAASVVLWRGLHGHPHPRFGPANRVTLARLAVTALLAGLALEMTRRTPADPAAVAWAVVLLATITAVVDAADGPLARRSGLASAFGARFDMETDALFMLVLCALIVLFGKTGAWVFASGLMRYAFVVAPRLPGLQWLGQPMPPARRRQTVCVLQIVALIVCIGPIVTPAWCNAIAAAGLALLAWSFAVDVAWLHSKRGEGGQQPMSSSDESEKSGRIDLGN